MNIQEKLVEEFERIITVREHLRCHWRHNKTDDPAETAKRLTSLAQINEVVQQCREALGNDDAVDTLARKSGKALDALVNRIEFEYLESEES